jgi:diguanylate cyclase (GGDEF)-like protein
MLDKTDIDIRVLLIDDDQDMQVLVSEMLSDIVRTSFSLDWCDTYNMGLDILRNQQHDVCLLDYRLGEKNGVELLSESISDGVTIPLILLTGIDAGDLDVQALAAGATDYIEKQNLNSVLLERSIRYSIEHKRIQRELIRLAQYDTLTGLANRTLFMDAMAAAIARADRYNWNVAVLFLDIDHFKNINDSLGHDAGDRLLISFTKRLKFSVRASDLVARFGGDEFAVLLENINSVSAIAQTAKNILDDMAAPHSIGDQVVIARPSIGIVTYPDLATDPESLIKAADTAMYEAKKRGRYNYQFFVNEMQDRVVQRTQFEADMGFAIERDELRLFYQPQIDAVTGNIVGLEALMRWQHKSRGLVMPSIFIPVAEECGLIFSIGEWVFKEACQQAKAWEKEKSLSDAKVAINLSAHHLQQTTIVDTIVSIIENAEIEPGKIELELTETAVMGNPKNANIIFTQLQKLGFHIAIDDFGTGYSSLQYLAELPINTLKIDRAFVNLCTKDEKQSAIVISTIGLAHNLGLKVVAEGVETQEQIDFLCENDCDILQGYFFSQPLPYDQLINSIQKS